MPRKKIVGKYAKAKQNRQKTVVKVAPRLRLEPRLTPSPSKNSKGYQKLENPKDCLEEKFSNETNLQEQTYEQDSDREDSLDELGHECADAANVTAKEKEDYETENTEIKAPDADEDDEILENSFTEKLTFQRKRCKRMAIDKTHNWTDRELIYLAYGLQAHGFSDLKKLAECVKTKNENDIQLYLKARRIEAGYNPNHIKINRQGNRWSTLSRGYLTTWPNIRKWRKTAYEQMLVYARSKDYSKPAMLALCKKFYEEEPEPSDSEIINTKLIYKYITACMAGDVPPQLPPKESALVLDLLREVRLMPIAYDFEEERKFLQDFRSATRFKPFHVKDEFKKRYKVEEPEEKLSSNTVAVPETVFLDLSRHKRLTQSFSPLVTPVWMLQKEQEILEKYVAESNVYVD